MFSFEVPASKNLRIPLERATAAVNKNTPIETCVLIEVYRETGICLTTLDSRTHQLKLKVPGGNIFNEGACLIPAPLLNQMVKTMQPDMPLTVQVDAAANQLVLEQPGIKIDLELFADPVEMFPVQKELPTTVTVVDAERLSESVKKALILSQKEEFIVFVGTGKELKVYTRWGGRMFSKTVMDCEEVTDEWSVGAPITLLARFPTTLAGPCRILMDENSDVFGFESENEHLLIRRLVTDNLSHLVDSVLEKASDKYWVIKTDGLLADLKRAALIRDRAGIELSKKHHQLIASYGSAGKGSATSRHDLLQGSTSLETMNLDPILFERAAQALEAVDLVGEQVEESVPSVVAGKPAEVYHNLRIRDHDAPEFRSVILTSLQAD